MNDRAFTALLWALFVTGVVLIIFADIWFVHAVAGPASSLGEALFVASVLGLTVDKYVKLKLSREVSRNVMEATLGHHLPPALHAELESITRYKIVRRNFKIRYTLTLVDHAMWLDSFVDFEAENMTDEKQTFTHTMWVQKPFGHKDTSIEQLLLAKCKTGRKDDDYEYKSNDLQKASSDVAGNARLWTKSVGIQPKEVVRFWSRTRQVFPPEHVDLFIFTDPTIGVEVSVTCPDSHKVEVLMLHRLETQVVATPVQTWELRNAAFLPNTGVSIEWRVQEQVITVAPPTDATTPALEEKQ